MPWWSIIAVFQSQHPHTSLLFKTSVYWINIWSSFTSSPCLEAMENYWLAKMKVLRHSSCGSWWGSQQVRTPSFKQGRRHGSHVDTAELQHSRAPFISGYLSCCSPTVFQTSFLRCLIKLLNIQKEAKGSSLDVEKKNQYKNKKPKGWFFSCCAWEQLGCMLQLECQNEQSYLSSFETCYLPQGHMKGKFTTL